MWKVARKINDAHESLFSFTMSAGTPVGDPQPQGSYTDAARIRFFLSCFLCVPLFSAGLVYYPALVRFDELTSQDAHVSILMSDRSSFVYSFSAISDYSTR